MLERVEVVIIAFFFEGPLHSREGVIHNGFWLIFWNTAISVDPGLDENGAPLRAIRGIKLIGTADVALGVVSDHENSVKLCDVVKITTEELGSVLLKDALGKRISFRVRLADNLFFQVGPVGGVFPDSFERSPEPTLAETGHVIGCSPEEVRVAKYQCRLAILLPSIVWEGFVPVLLRVGAEDSLAGEEQVEYDLGVKSPVTWVVENEHCIYLQ